MNSLTILKYRKEFKHQVYFNTPFRFYLKLKDFQPNSAVTSKMYLQILTALVPFLLHASEK